jgi:hypothetical protein
VHADVNALFGNKIAFAQIPTIAVKWVTYALFLHVVALLLAAVSAFFGLLAHVREMSMTCFSTCISGFAAAAAMFAFVIDLVFFFLAKARINKVPNGKAEIGLAIWLTLAAWVMLFFSGCFFAVGRCCVSRRPRGPSKADKYAPTGNNNNHNNGYNGNVGNINNNGTEEALRMQAIKTEADRKQNQVNENGLPAFHEYSRAKPAETQPLTALVDGNEVYVDEEATPQKYAGQPQAQQYSGGYVPAAAGNRAVEQLNDGARRQPSTQPSYPPQPTYPPQPQESTYAAPAQPSGLHAQGVSGQASSLYNPAVPGGYGAGASAAVVAGSMAYNNRSQNLSPGPQQGHQQYPSGALYGHGQDKTSCTYAVKSCRIFAYHDNQIIRHLPITSSLVHIHSTTLTLHNSRSRSRSHKDIRQQISRYITHLHTINQWLQRQGLTDSRTMATLITGMGTLKSLTRRPRRLCNRLRNVATLLVGTDTERT